jgi:N6-adenosine-specific RNA methylase IME4
MPLRPFPRKKYNVIYADPPWPESDPSRDRRSRRGLAAQHYKTMSAEAILRMGPSVKAISDANCICFMWTTPRHIPLALQTLDQWGFEFVVVGFTWMKKNMHSDTPFFGMGYYTRSNAEFCLLGRKGSLKPVRKDISSAVYESRGIHSEKPATVRTRIEQLFGDVPRIELFSRHVTPGWDVWGNGV